MSSCRRVRLLLIVCILYSAVNDTACTTYHVSFLGRNTSYSQIVGNLFIKTMGTTPEVSFNISSQCNPILSDWTLGTGFTSMSFSSAECSELVPNGIDKSWSGIKVHSPENFTLHVIQSPSISGNISDGYLAIPDHQLGNVYYVVTYCELGGMCQFAVVAAYNDTLVAVTFPDNVDTGVICANGETLLGNASPGTPVYFTINEFEVLHFESEHDLSGTYIEASEDVAVIVGARGIPNKDGTFSEIAEQIPPANKWGTDFVVVPNYINEVGDVVKIVTKTENTSIHILGFSPFVIPNAGEAVERRIDWQMHSTIYSSNPVLVVQLMNLNLYNSTTTTGSTAMVLVQHKQQWVNTEQFFHCTVSPTNNDSLIVAVSDSDQSTSVQFVPSPTLYFSPWATVAGSEFETVIYKPSVTETSITGATLSTYGFCEGKYAIILGANWDWNNQPCMMTTSSPGDDVDNDCDGAIDEDICTANDLQATFYSEQDTSGNVTFNTYVVRGTGQVVITVQTCDIATLTLSSDDSDAIITIQISPSLILEQICISTCFPSSSNVNSVTDCTVGEQYSIQWFQDEFGLHHIFRTKDTEYQWDITGVSGVTYDKLIVSAYTGAANFTVGLAEKDCGKITSGDADMAGVKFVIPVADTDNNFDILFYTSSIITGPVVVELSVTNSKGVIALNADQTYYVSKLDITQLTYNQIIATAVGGEVYVYLFREISQSSFGLNILPVDVLGPAYHLFQDSIVNVSSAKICDVYTTGRHTTANNMIIESDRPTVVTVDNMSTSYFTKGLLFASRPVAVFCGSFKDTLVQMPPRESFGKDFFIPKLDLESINAAAELIIVLAEDSTVLTIRGDYDQVDTVDLIGDVHARLVENGTMYNIASSKPVQVILQVRSSMDSWAAAVAIPPVTQYKSMHTFPGLNNTFTFMFSSAIDANGTEIPSHVTEAAIVQGLANTFDYGAPVFSLTFVSNLGKQYIVASDVWFEDQNEVCTLTVGSPGDGVDNDCDGLIDEEQCSDSRVPGTIDFDLDGTLNEDCRVNSSATSPPIQLSIPLDIIVCPPNISSINESDEEIIITNNSTNATIGNLTTPNLPSSGYPPTFQPLTSSSGGVILLTSTPSPDSTAAPVETCETDCVCPCGWVNPPQNYTTEELEAIIVEIQEKLRVSKAELSATIRKKTSAPDDRPSATAVGYIGLVSIVITLGAVALLDITTLFRDAQMLMNNVREVFNP